MRAWAPVIEPGPIIVATCLLFAFATSLTNAAPTIPDHSLEHSTEIEYYPVADATGCYYNFQHYDEGDRIITNEPCLNCTCHNRMLMCYLRVCPFTKAIGANCKVEKRPDQCCPVITCPEVPVHLVTSTVPSTAVGHLNEYGCTIDGLFYSDGARVPSNPDNPCELCYCIRNKTACVMQECTLRVEGCAPVFQEGVCCPVRYNCDHPNYIEGPTTPEITTTSTTTTTTTTLAPTTTLQPFECIYNGDSYADGKIVKKDLPCEKCYCMRGDIVCAVQECSPTPLDKVNCTASPVREGQCCPDSYDCAGVSAEDLTTISYDSEITTQTSIPNETEVSEQDETTSKIGEEQTTEAKLAEIPESTTSSEVPEVIEQFTSKAIETPQPTEVISEAGAEDTSVPTLDETSESVQEVTEGVQETIKPENDQETTVTSGVEIGISTEKVDIVQGVTDIVKSEEEVTVQSTEAPIESFTSRVTAAIESVTSRITETVETVTTAITDIYTQRPNEPTVSNESEVHTHSTALGDEIGDKAGVTPAISDKEQPVTETEMEEEIHEGSGTEPGIAEEIVTEEPSTYDSTKEGGHQAIPEVHEEDKTEKAIIGSEVSDDIGTTEASTLKPTHGIDENTVFETTEKVIAPAEDVTHEPSIVATDSSEEIKPVDEKVSEITEASVLKHSETSTEAIETEEIVTSTSSEQDKHPDEVPITSVPVEDKPSIEEEEKGSEGTEPTKTNVPETKVPEDSVFATTLRTVDESKSPEELEAERGDVTERVKLADEEQKADSKPTEETAFVKETATISVSKASQPSDDQPPVTEAGILPEKCDQHSCVKVSSESSSEKTLEDTSEKHHVEQHATQPSTEVKPETENVTIVEIKGTSTEKEEVEIVTEIPTKKTELPEAMDHVSETAQSTEVPKYFTPVASDGTEPTTSEITIDHTDVFVNEIGTESSERTITETPTKVESAETEIPEAVTKADTDKEIQSVPEVTELPKADTDKKIQPVSEATELPKHTDKEIQPVSEVTELPKEEENEIDHESEITHEQIHPVTEKVEIATTYSDVEEKHKTPEIISATEKAIIPEVCTSETECVHPAIPYIPPTAASEAESQKPNQFDTFESTTIPAEGEGSIDESNKIPDSGIEETKDVTHKPEIIITTTGIPTQQEVSKDKGDSVASTAPHETVPTEPKAEITTELIPEISTQSSVDQTELPPREIPGEGSCLVDGKTYKNNSSVPPINHCQVACKCISSILRCKSVECLTPPEGAQNCILIKSDQNKGCCPTYSCTGSEVTSAMESDSHIVDITTPKSIAETTLPHVTRAEPSKGAETTAVEGITESTSINEEPTTESKLEKSTESAPEILSSSTVESEKPKGTKAETGQKEIENDIPPEVIITSKPIETSTITEEQQTSVTSEPGINETSVDSENEHKYSAITEKIESVATTTELITSDEKHIESETEAFSESSTEGQTQVPESKPTEQQLEQSKPTETPETVSHAEEEPSKITTEYQTEKQPEEEPITEHVDSSVLKVEVAHDKLTTLKPEHIPEDIESTTETVTLPEIPKDEEKEAFTTYKSLTDEATTSYVEEDKIKPTEVSTTGETQEKTTVTPIIKEASEVPVVSPIPDKEQPQELTKKPATEDILTEINTEKYTEPPETVTSQIIGQTPLDTDKHEIETEISVSEIEKETSPESARPSHHDEDKEYPSVADEKAEQSPPEDTTVFISTEEVTKLEEGVKEETSATELPIQKPKATEIPKEGEIVTEIGYPTEKEVPKEAHDKGQTTVTSVTEQPSRAQDHPSTEQSTKAEEPEKVTVLPEVQPELTTAGEEQGTSVKTEEEEKLLPDLVTAKIPETSEEPLAPSVDVATLQPAEGITTLSPEFEAPSSKQPEHIEPEITEVPTEESTATKSEESQKPEIPAIAHVPSEGELTTQIATEPSEEQTESEILESSTQQFVEEPTPSVFTEIKIGSEETLVEQQTTVRPTGETASHTEEPETASRKIPVEKPVSDTKESEITSTEIPVELPESTETATRTSQAAITSSVSDEGQAEVTEHKAIVEIATVQPDKTETGKIDSESHVTDKVPHVDESITQTAEKADGVTQKTGDVSSATDSSYVGVTTSKYEEEQDTVFKVPSTEVSEPVNASSIERVSKPTVEESTDAAVIDVVTAEESSKPTVIESAAAITTEVVTEQEQATTTVPAIATGISIASEKTKFEKPESITIEAVTEKSTDLPKSETQEPEIPVQTDKAQIPIEQGTTTTEVSEKETEIPELTGQTALPEAPTTETYKSSEVPESIETDTRIPQFEKPENETDAGLKATKAPEIEATVTKQQPSSIVTEIVTEKSVVTHKIVTEIPKDVSAVTNKSVDEFSKVPEIQFTSPELTTIVAVKEQKLNISEPGSLFTSPTEVPISATTTKNVPGELSTSAPVTRPPPIIPEQTTTTRPQIPGESFSEEPEHPEESEEEEELPEEPEDSSETGEESNAFGPGTCRYGGKVYVSAQQIPRDDPCDFCFCFRSDIICLQQSCPPPIPRCHEEPIRGFCCPRYECPVSTATTVNVTTSTTTTTTTLPPHFLSHVYKGRASKSGCQIQGKAYKVGEVIRATSGPCLHCTCGGDGHMKCDPKPCSPEPMLRQMIAAAASRRRR